MSRTQTLTLWLASVVLVLFFFTACSDSSGDDQIPDGDNSSNTGCTSNADCIGTNPTCDLISQVCVEHGNCQTDTECASWYGTSKPYCAGTGICVLSIGPDGDQDNAVDGDGTDDPDGDTTPDGDQTEGCEDFTGLYDGEFACGSVENHDTYVVVDYTTCDVVFYYGGESIEGEVTGSSIETDNGKTCTGNFNSGNDTVVLNCNDNCTITLTPKQAAGTGRIDVRPTEFRFGAVSAGEIKYQEVSVSNNGDGALNIEGLFFTPETSTEFSLANPDDWPDGKSIASGLDEDLIVEFAPEGDEPQQGMLVLLTDDPSQPITRLRLSSEAKCVPQIVVERAAISYGCQAPGFDNRKYVLVKNTGCATAQVVAVNMLDDSNGAYTIEWTPENQPPFSLDASGAQAITVNYKPIENVHPYDSQQVGFMEVVWLDKDQAEKKIQVDLVGCVTERQPACLDVQPLDGSSGIWGFGDVPGPGIDFGYSQMNVPNTRQVSFSNCGDLPLSVTGLAWNALYDFPPAMIEPRPFYEDYGSFHDYTLQRGETIYVNITFTPPTENSRYTAGFQFFTNAEKLMWLDPNFVPDPTVPTVVGIEGVGARRGIEVIPSKLDFGLVTLECCSRAEEVKVWNVGNLELTITDMQIGAGSDERFEIVSGPGQGDFPITLGGGHPQSFSFEVKFCPSHEGPHVGRVEIISDDANNAQLVVPLQGEGTLLSHATDHFTQNQYPMVDILWVVDCSGSMQEEQDNLADNFDNFINDALQWGEGAVDLHIGVTSMDIVDPDHSGKLQCSPAVLSNSGPDALTDAQIKSEFKDCVKLGTSCDGNTEAGLEAAHLALSEPLISNENAGFLRDEAKLSIIFVSDEPDNSSSEVPFFIDFLRSIKGMRNTSMIETYAIVGDDPGGCQNENTGDASAGPRYIEVSDACNRHDNEHFESICEDSFDDVFNTMAENLFVLFNQFFLTRQADPDTIVVKVDGVIDNTWEYDEDSNSIIYPEGQEPPGGSTIDVDYDTLCLP